MNRQAMATSEPRAVATGQRVNLKRDQFVEHISSRVFGRSLPLPVLMLFTLSVKPRGAR